MTALRNWIAPLAVIGTVGCAGPGPALHDYSVRPLPLAQADAAFEAAESALLEFGYEIAAREPAAGRLETVPIESTEASSSEGVSLRTARLRRVAQIRVVRAGDEARLYCNVSVQQLRTEAHRWLAFDRGSSDMPGQTPIEREAGTTTEQNAVWETIHRDKAAERAILTAALERLGGDAPPGVP
jgi:hypothetical protein